MSVTSLDQVIETLRPLVGNDLALPSICTRVMLRTGVNLRSPRPDQLTDKAMLGKVVATLSDMGYTL